MKESRKLKKGEHEKAIEKAKEMLDKGIGMGKIMEETNLTEKDVLKAKDKWVDLSQNIFQEGSTGFITKSVGLYFYLKSKGFRIIVNQILSGLQKCNSVLFLKEISIILIGIEWDILI